MTETKVRKIHSQVSSVGVIPSADSRVPHPSPQSNNRNNVGKSVTDGRTPDSSLNIISPQSAGIPSSHPDTDGNLNGGKRNDEPSVQQGELSPQPNGIISEGNNDYHQKPNSYYSPNGFHSNE